MELPISPWEHWHYRFGLAGEGQADLIEQLLRRRRGVVLDIGCGPQGRHAANLASLSALLIAADKNVGMVQSASADLPMRRNVSFLVANAHNLPLADGSVDHVVSLGMFAYIQEPGSVFEVH